MSLKSKLIRIAKTNPRLNCHVQPIIQALSKTAGPGAGVKFFLEDAYVDLMNRFSDVEIMKIRQPALLDNFLQIDQILARLVESIDRLGGFRATIEDVKIESYYNGAKVDRAGVIEIHSLNMETLMKEMQWYYQDLDDEEYFDEDEIRSFQLDSVTLDNHMHGAGYRRWRVDPNDAIEVTGTAEYHFLDEDGDWMFGGEVEFEGHFVVSEEFAYAYQDLDSDDDDEDEDYDY